MVRRSAKLRVQVEAFTTQTAEKDKRIATLEREEIEKLAEKDARIGSVEREEIEKLAEKNKEIAKLEKDLLPFKVFALQKYTGDESERLHKLASDIRKMQGDIDAVKQYSDVATMDMIGKNFIGHGVIVSPTEITGIMAGALEGNQFATTTGAEKKYREVAEKFPTFPFSYFLISRCLRARDDPSWKDYAHVALDILEKTTTIAGHHQDHDKVLRILQLELLTPDSAPNP